MTIYIVTFTSLLGKQTLADNPFGTVINELRKQYTIELVDQREMGRLHRSDFKILLIETGGVEHLVINQYELLSHPTILLANGENNSLASAMEIATWLRSKGMKNEILYGKDSFILQRIHILYKIFTANNELNHCRIGVIGTPSPWLIASNVDYLLAKRRWGVEYIDLPLEQVYEPFSKIKDEEVELACKEIASKALTCKESTPKDLVKAMRFYKALKEVCIKEKLDAVTLNCFKVIDQIGTTGCLALSLLNDEGIIAGCEGDLQSIFTMLVVKALTGKSTFMGNPAKIDIESNILTLAHCTIGLKQTKDYTIRSHFESKIGIAIQGTLSEGDVSIIKCGGECLDDYYLSSGTLLKNTDNPKMCRTQIQIMMNTPVDYFIKNSIGNHHIVVQGNEENLLNEFFQSNICRQIK
ncbi:MAG: fucose isomerase [Bacteroidaceae bacterium]